MAHELADELALAEQCAVAGDALGEVDRVAELFRQRQDVELGRRQFAQAHAQLLQGTGIALALALARPVLLAGGLVPAVFPLDHTRPRRLS